MRPAGVLQVEPVDLSAALQGRPGLSRQRPGQLVPLLPDGAGQRAGRRRQVRAVRLRRLPPGPGAVVLWHHKVRGGAPGLLRPPGLARENQGHADQLDWPQRGRGDQLRHLGVRAGGDRNPHLHHSHRHHLRRHIRGHCAGAPPGGQADHAGPPGGGRRLHRGGASAVGGGAAVHGAREIGRLHRLLRSQPAQRRPGPHLRCRLRAANLRHGNRDGSSRSRPAGFRLRQEVRSGHPRGHRPSGLGRRRAGAGLRGGRGAGELRSIRRPARAGGQGAHRRSHRGQRLGASHRLLQAAGLAHLPPAVLGHAHTDAVLRWLRCGAGAGRGPAGAPAGGRPVPAHRRVSPEVPRAVPELCVPLLRRARPEGDGHDGHLSWTPPGITCATPAPSTTRVPSTPTRPEDGCR